VSPARNDSRGGVADFATEGWTVKSEGACELAPGACDTDAADDDALFACAAEGFAREHRGKIRDVLGRACQCGEGSHPEPETYELSHALLGQEGGSRKLCFRARGCGGREHGACFPALPDAQLCNNRLCTCKERGAYFRFADEADAERELTHVPKDLGLPFFRMIDQITTRGGQPHTVGEPDDPEGAEAPKGARPARSTHVEEVYEIEIKWNRSATQKVLPLQSSGKGGEEAAGGGSAFADAFVVNCAREGDDFTDGECDCTTPTKKSDSFVPPVSRDVTPFLLSKDDDGLNPNLLINTNERTLRVYAKWAKGWKDLLNLISENSAEICRAVRMTYDFEDPAMEKEGWCANVKVKDSSRFVQFFVLYLLAGVTPKGARGMWAPLGKYSFTGLVRVSAEPSLQKLRAALQPPEELGPDVWGHVVALKFSMRSADEKVGGHARTVLVVNRKTRMVMQLQAYSANGTAHGRNYTIEYDLWAWISGITLYSDGGLSVNKAVDRVGKLALHSIDEYMELFGKVFLQLKPGDDKDIQTQQADAWEALFGCRPASSFNLFFGESFLLTAPVIGNPEDGFPMLSCVIDFLKNDATTTTTTVMEDIGFLNRHLRRQNLPQTPVASPEAGFADAWAHAGLKPTQRCAKYAEGGRHAATASSLDVDPFLDEDAFWAEE